MPEPAPYLGAYSGVEVDAAIASLLSAITPGTFTPTVVGSTVAGTVSYSTQKATYIKVGRGVFVFGRVTWISTTGTGNLLIGGLPFPVETNVGIIYPAHILPQSVTDYETSSISGSSGSGESTIAIREYSGGGPAVALPLPASGTIDFSMMYLTT